MAGRPVLITVGTVWHLQVESSPPRPKITASVAVTGCVLTLARIFFGVSYFKDCPQQPHIPNYLLGLALATLLMVPFFTLPWESSPARSREPPKCFESCLMCLIGLFTFTWLVAGDVWVFSIYQPNYDPAAADGRYCNKNLYTFAFWNAVYETFAMFVVVTKFLKGLMCYVVMNPGAANRAFSSNV